MYYERFLIEFYDHGTIKICLCPLLADINSGKVKGSLLNVYI